MTVVASGVPDTGQKPPLLRIETITKRFGDQTAVDRLSLDIHHNEFFALLGPSGCGKSTLMRMIAGFETPTEGRLLLDGQDLAGVPPHQRPINMMFQSYALFPHMTVADNIGFGLKQERLPKAEIADRVAEMLALVQLEPFAGRKPDRLSGGQRQRVALARALAKRPRLLLLDEPMGALDKKLREETQYELMALQDRLATTFVIVTHDQEEAMTVADRMAVMERGTIAQLGTPVDIYEQPGSRYVASFIGDINIIPGRVAGFADTGTQFETSAGRIVTARGEENTGDTAWLSLRPEKLRITHDRPDGEAVNALRGTVAEVGYLGDMSVYKVRVGDGLMLKVAVPNLSRVRIRSIGYDDEVWLSWEPDAGVLLTR